jgi:hypothetical protein
MASSLTGGLASSAGGGFELFREPHHTDEDIERAKSCIRRDRDVAGGIRVTRIDEDVNLNPRYLAYCQAHDKTPERMHEHDDHRWPGGIMTGFLLWSAERHITTMVFYSPALLRRKGPPG